MEEKKGNDALSLPLCRPWVLYTNEFVQIWVGPCQDDVFFEETFTDGLSLGSPRSSLKDVEDSLNSADLLECTGFMLMPACKSNGWSPFRLQKPHVKPKDARHVCRQHFIDGRRRDVIKMQETTLLPVFVGKKAPGLTVGSLILRDQR